MLRSAQNMSYIICNTPSSGSFEKNGYFLPLELFKRHKLYNPAIKHNLNRLLACWNCASVATRSSLISLRTVLLPATVLLPHTDNCVCILECLYACWGHVLAHLVEAQRYQSEGHGFDSRRCHMEFFNDIILPTALWHLGVDSASNRNGYQEYFLGVKAAGA